MTPDSSRYYGTVSRLLHWLMAVCFVVMLVTAIIWNLTEADWVGSLYGLHKSFGFILMVLIVVRILWAAARRQCGGQAGAFGIVCADVICAAGRHD